MHFYCPFTVFTKVSCSYVFCMHSTGRHSVRRTSRNTLVVRANAYRGVLRDVRATLCRPVECIQKTEVQETFVNTVQQIINMTRCF